MTGGKARLLLVTNGAVTTMPALEYGAWLAARLQWDVVLLGVVEAGARDRQVEGRLAQAAESLSSTGVPFERRVERGNLGRILAGLARQDDFLTVIGPLARPPWRRWAKGRSFRRLLARVASPLLYVPAQHLVMQRVLVCLGGLGYAMSAEHLGLDLAQAFGASLTLLHVVEPVTFDYPTSREVQAHWEDVLESDTPQGSNLRLALGEAERSGLTATLRVRHGHVVHEILSEVQEGAYDLVAMGTHHAAQGLRHLFTPDVTAEVAEAIDRPVLAVRSGFELPR